MTRPDYHGGSIVNLMSSIKAALGGGTSVYPPLRGLDPAILAAGNLVLLVVDGLGYRYLAEAGADSALRRHLRGSMTSVFPSTTASAITTFMTGLAPQQHALTGWHTYFKELGSIAAVLPFRPRHGGPSLREAGIAPAELFDYPSVFDAVPVPCYAVSPARIVHSDFNIAHCGTARRVGYGSLQQMFHAIAGIVGGGTGRKYVYAYYPEIDGLAHEHGVASSEVGANFTALDEAFARFLDAIRGSGSTVIVTADHGLIDTDPGQLIELARHPQLAEALLLPLCGEQRAAYCYIHPDKREQFEHYVQSVLGDFATLWDSPELIDQGWFGLGEPHPRLKERVGHYALLMKGNYAIKDWILGERRHVQIGVHGGTSEQEMTVPLIVAQGATGRPNMP